MKTLIRALLVPLLATLLGLSAAAAQAQQAQQAILDVVRGDDDYPPFEMMAQGKLAGLHVELVEATAKILGMSVRWTALPWKRALLMVETGQADAVTYIARTPEREAWAVFLDGNQLSSAEVRFIARKEDAARLSFDGDLPRFLAKHSLLTLRGFQFGKAEIDRVKRLEAGSMNDLVRMLLAGHGTVAAVNWPDFKNDYQGRPEFARIAALQPAIVNTRNYIAFSSARGHATLAQRFAQALSRFRQSAEYAQMMTRYEQEQ